MRGIADIVYDGGSGRFEVRIFDDESGWSSVWFDDAASLVGFAGEDLDAVDTDSLDPEGASAIAKAAEAAGVPVPRTISEVTAKGVQPSDRGLPGTDRETDDLFWKDTRVYYVTDIHLDSKLLRTYGDSASDGEAEELIESVVGTIKKDFWGLCSRRILLIGGDVSHDCRLTEMFYRKLAESIGGKRIMALLGNHEYWDGRTRESDPDDIGLTSEHYAKLFDELYISFADDMLFTYKGGGRYFVRGDEILKASTDEIREFVEDSPLTILGGTGFSGLNERQNCECGMYRDAIRSREQEKALSSRFDAIYGKVLEAVPDTRVVVFTHMPMADWSERTPNPNWVYVSGHTHRNFLDTSGMARVYADNQIGYGGKVHLKSFFLSREIDIFRYHPDGIHTITREQYRDFYRGKDMNMTCNRDGEYIMVKRSPLYCFFIYMGDMLYMLDGGSIHRVNHNLDYYHKHMIEYGEAVDRSVRKYQNRLRSISEAVKSIGGDGRIHGCIVDVDYYNHVFLNPFDGTVTSYTASDIVNKFVHPGFEAMLKSQRDDLFQEYRKALKQGDSNLPAALTKKSRSGGYYSQTDIYRVSELFYKIQHMTEHFVIRRWHDEFLSMSDEDGQVARILGLLTGDSGGR